MHELSRELRHALRALARTPVFTTVVFLSLGLGIGGCTAAFTVLNALIFRPLPEPEPERLVLLYATTSPRSDAPSDALTLDRMFGWLETPFRSFDGVAAYVRTTLRLHLDATPAEVQAAAVSADFFHVVGVPALLGRTLDAVDAEPGAPAAIVLSHRLWRARFGGDPGVVGRAVRLGDLTYTVVGVLPAASGHPRDAEAWMPIATQAAAGLPNVAWGIGRLGRGATIDQARAEVRQRVQREFAEDSTRFGGRGATATPYLDSARRVDAPVLWLAVAATGAVFLVVLANLANLFLTRAIDRAHEFAVRAALGAARWPLARPLVVESALVSLAGAAAGLVLARWGRDAARGLGVRGLDGVAVPLDVRVIGFGVALAAFAALLLALEPIRQLRGLDLRGRLQEDSAALTGAPLQRRARSVLLAVEVALALGLAGGAGVALTAFRNLLRMDVGYDAARLVALQPDYAEAGYDAARQRLALDELLEHARRTPGAAGATAWREVATVWPPPPVAELFAIEGSAHVPGFRETPWRYYEVRPNFFDVSGVRLARGRPFTEADAAGSLPVAIVNETAARRWWPGEDPIGKRIRLGGQDGDTRWLTVVGVAALPYQLGWLGRAKAAAGREDPLVFRPMDQAGRSPAPGWIADDCPYCRGYTLAVRAASDAAPLTATLRAELRRVAPDLGVVYAGTLLDLQTDVTGRELRQASPLLSGFAALALLLALLGVYGVAADHVARRTREIGIRIALGARGGVILREVVFDSARAVAVGIMAGLTLLVASQRVIDRLFRLQIYDLGTGAADPAVLAGATAAVLVVASLAACLAAHRATRVDPMTALRSE